MSFISVADLAAYTGSTIEDMGWLGEFAVRVAEEAVAGILRVSIDYVEDEEITLDGTGTDSLVLPAGPVVDVSEVTENDEELTVDEDYALRSSGVLRRTYPYVWTRGRGNIAVTYSHGYTGYGSEAGNQLPFGIRDAALGYAASVFNAGQSVVGTGIESEQLGAYSYSVSSASLAAAAATAQLDDLRAKLRPYVWNTGLA